MEKNIFGLVKKFLQVARVHKKMAQVGSGWPKWPRVGSNLGSVPTRPIPKEVTLYQCIESIP